MEVKAGYKQTEIGMIPEDWDLKSIDTIAKIEGGGTPSTLIDEYWNGQIPWVSAGDISNAKGRYVKETEFYISDLGLSNSPTKILPKNTTIIIARGATVGRMAQLGKDMAFNQTCYCLLPNNGLDKNYLYYSMLFSVNSIIAMSYGTIFGTITTNSFRDWHIPLPPLAEQEAIAEALSDADALIEALEQLIAKKRQVKQGAMQELLTGKKRVVESGKWEVKSFGELFDISGGLSASRDQLSSDGYCYLHYGDIHLSNKTFIDVKAEFHDIPKLNVPLNKVSSSALLNDGDIVFVDASEDDEGASKHVVVVNPEGIPYISGLHTIVAKSKTNELGHLYRRYCFQTRAVKKQFLFYSVGTKVTGISKTNIAKITVPIPPLPEQTAIAEILSDMDAEITALEGKLSKAREVKAGMMSVLLMGRVRLV